PLRERSERKRRPEDRRREIPHRKVVHHHDREKEATERRPREHASEDPEAPRPVARASTKGGERRNETGRGEQQSTDELELAHAERRGPRRIVRNERRALHLRAEGPWPTWRKKEAHVLREHTELEARFATLPLGMPREEHERKG